MKKEKTIFPIPYTASFSPYLRIYFRVLNLRSSVLVPLSEKELIGTLEFTEKSGSKEGEALFSSLTSARPSFLLFFGSPSLYGSVSFLRVPSS